MPQVKDVPCQCPKCRCPSPATFDPGTNLWLCDACWAHNRPTQDPK